MNIEENLQIEGTEEARKVEHIYIRMRDKDKSLIETYRDNYREALRIDEDELFVYYYEAYIEKGLNAITKMRVLASLEEAALKQIQNGNRDTNYLKEITKGNLAQKQKVEIKVVNRKELRKLASFYNQKVYNEGFFLTAEGISKFLDVEIQYTQQNIIPHLRELRLLGARDANEDDKLKRVRFGEAKSEYKMIFWRTSRARQQELNDEVICDKDWVKFNRHYNALMSKKSLYSLDSFVKYLQGRAIEVEEIVCFPLVFSREQIERIQEKYKNQTVTKAFLEFYLEHILKQMINDKVVQEETTVLREVRIEEITRDYFKLFNSFKLFLQDLKSNTKLRMYSVKSLKVLWDVMYNKQVADSLRTVPHVKIALNKTTKRKTYSRYKKTSVRYLLGYMDARGETTTGIHNIREDDSILTQNYIQKYLVRYLRLLYPNVTDFFTEEILKSKIKYRPKKEEDEDFEDEE